MLKRKPTITPESRFSKAPPGYSLTGSKGKWPWERPPQFATAPEAVDAIIENLEKPEIQEMQIQLLAAGVSIEELVTTTVRVGFMEGKFSVDVAELIKAPLSFYYMGLAAEADIDAKVFATKNGLPRTNYGMKDSQILTIMRDRNPDFANYIQNQLPRQAEERKQRQMMMQQQIEQESFLGVQPIEGEVVEQPMGEGMVERPAPQEVEGEE